MPKSTSPFPRRKSSSSSPFSTLPRKKPSIQRQSSLKDEQPRLDDTGLTPSLVPKGIPQDVLALIEYIWDNTRDPIPDVSGMNSTRIAETLRYRESLPPIVSLAHLHALSVSPTATERELAGLMARGVVRKVSIPNRGAKGGSTLEEGVVLVEAWKGLLRGREDVDEDVKTKYLALMDAAPTYATTSTSGLERHEVQQLVHAGFLTNPSALSSNPLSATAGLSSPIEVSKAGYSAPTGSLAAVGGQGAIHESGGSGSVLTSNATSHRLPAPQRPGTEMTFSLPHTGPYLKHLTSARLHLVALLKALSPRYREATRDLLKEKWEGNVLGDAASVAKRARGEWSGVLPGKTKKWKDFYGLRFESVLAECVGAGVVEMFDTGSVGLAVRAQ